MFQNLLHSCSKPFDGIRLFFETFITLQHVKLNVQDIRLAKIHFFLTILQVRGHHCPWILNWWTESSKNLSIQFKGLWSENPIRNYFTVWVKWIVINEIISDKAVSMNEKYFPEPFKFDPNRYLTNDGTLKELVFPIQKSLVWIAAFKIEIGVVFCLMIGWKNPGIIPSYRFCDFFLKNDNLGLKMKILKFLEIQPSLMINIRPEM